MHKLDIKLFEEKLSSTTAEVDLANTNEKINKIIENLITSLLDAEFSSIWLYDEKNTKLLRERDDSNTREISISNKEGLIYKCLETREHSIYNYITSEKGYIPLIDNPDKIKIKSKIIYPILENGSILGIVTAYSSVRKIKLFTENDLKLLKTLSPYIKNIIYKMHPEAKIEKNITNERRKQPLKRAEFDIAQKTKEIQKNQENIATLAFMSNTIHDIRTPANNLFGFLDLLEEQIDDIRLKQYLSNAKESASLINNLTNSILDRISSHQEKEKSKKEKINSIEFFTNIAEMFSSNMFSKKLIYNIFIDPLMPKTIITEPLKLKRVIINLINNAYKFTPSNHSIKFSILYKQKDKKLSISIRDTGIGIAKEDQKKIFEAFERIDNSTVLDYSGTGLGLAISSNYTKDLGGILKLESEIGKGSKFYFDIPIGNVDTEASFETINDKNIKLVFLMDKSNQPSASNITRHIIKIGLNEEQITAITSLSNYKDDITHLVIFQNKINDEIINNAIANNIKCLIIEESLFSIKKDDFHPSCKVLSQYISCLNKVYTFLKTTKKHNVLIIDDDEISIILVKTLLDDELCDISIARDGKEGLDMLIDAQKNGNPFSIVYLDNRMPTMDGLDILKQYRKYEKENQKNPIYAVSISGDTLKDEESKKLFDTFATKPFRKKDVKEALLKANIQLK